MNEDNERKPCCEEDFGGSHYHCGRCNKVSSMMGHSTSFCSKYSPSKKGGMRKGKVTMIVGGPSVPHHFCCPNDCQFDSPEEFVKEIEFWNGMEKLHDTSYRSVIEGIAKKLAFARRIHADSNGED